MLILAIRKEHSPANCLFHWQQIKYATTWIFGMVVVGHLSWRSHCGQTRNPSLKEQAETTPTVT